MRGRRLLCEKFRNLNRRGQWPLVSVEKDSHAQPPLAAMAVFPLPRAPSRRAAGNRLDASFGLARPCELGASPIGLAVVTAADRAAVTVRGGGVSADAEGISPLRRRGGGFPIAPATPSGLLLIGVYQIERWQGAAALSAAVTTTSPQGTAPNSQAEPTPQKQPTRTPAALREKGSGEEGLLSEKPPPPQYVPHPRLFGREREGGSFSSEKLPPSQSPSPRLTQIVLCFADLGDGGVAEGRELKGLGLRRKG